MLIAIQRYKELMKTTKRNHCSSRVILLMAMIFCFVNARSQNVSTVAGAAGIAGFVDGQGQAARFSNPNGIACDKNGNIYIADRNSNCIRKINSIGFVSTIAGTGAIGGTDGPGTTATFNEPQAVACDTLGNIYVADTKNYKIRKITSSGNVTTFAGSGTFGTTNGPVLIAQFGFPTGICTTPDGNIVYVADHNTHVIRKIFNGQVSDLAGNAYIAGFADGNGTAASFSHPVGIDIDNNGNIVVADEWNNKIRQVSPSGNVTTIAGTGAGGNTDGPATAATFNLPTDITVDDNGNIFVADAANNTIREIITGTLTVTTYAGIAGITGSADGPASSASFNSPNGISFCNVNHAIYVSDAANSTIRKITKVSSTTLNLFTTANNNTVCYGDSILLNAATNGFSGFTFMEGSTVVGSSNSGIITLPPFSAGQHSFTCYASDAGGAIANSQQLTITVSPQFIPTIVSSGSTTFCNGDSIMLTAQQGLAYLWNTGNTTQNIYINTGGPYSVTVTDQSGCTGISTVINATASAGPISVITPAGATQVCAGDSVLLNSGSGALWLWSNGATTQSIITTIPGNYIVTITDVAGCKTASTPLTITNFVGSQATISPTGIFTIVQGDSIVLSSSAASSYAWSNNATTKNIVVYNSGIYTVSITTINGCHAVSNPVQVIVITKQQLISATGAVIFCQGGSVTLQSFFSQGNQWYFNGLPLIGETNQQLTATDSGYYQVSAFQNNHWVFSDSLLVTVNSSPQDAVVNDTAVCSGTAPLIEAKSDAGTTVTWYNQDVGGTLLGTGNSFQCVPLLQNSTLYAEVTSANGCKAIDRAALNVTVNPSPIADFQFTVSQQAGNYVVLFQNLTSSADAYSWVFNDTTIQSNSVQDQPTHDYQAPGTYNVTLVASNSYGCIDSTNKKISVGITGDWFIPTTFTPNNDGHNDLFRVRGKNIVTKDIIIYDQWGSKIYEADESNPLWNGTVNGETVQNGTYIYKIKLSKLNAEDEVVTGTITVIK